jgi:hypothetical protein
LWNALQYVGSGLSLAAFVAAAVVFAYRGHLKRRAEIIKSAPEKERLEAIATTAEFFRVDTARLSRVQQEHIVLAQIHARARRDLLVTGVLLTLAVLLGAIAILAIANPKPVQSTFVVCIGDGIGCPENTSDFRFDCGFARAHPTNTDSAAAEEICRVQHVNYNVQRLSVYGGGNCGGIRLRVTCFW